PRSSRNPLVRASTHGTRRAHYRADRRTAVRDERPSAVTARVLPRSLARPHRRAVPAVGSPRPPRKPTGARGTHFPRRGTARPRSHAPTWPTVPVPPAEHEPPRARTVRG